ncbi:MAG: MFS transporter [Pseudomonadota bacterium]
MTEIRIADAAALPRWRRPEALLLLMSMAVWFGLSLWMVLINNFAVEMARFDGSDIGWLQSVREIPGFLAFLVVFLIRFIKEQRLAIVSLLLLGAATAVTSHFPSFWGLLITTFIGSVGFHYFETVNQSLQLQWLSKERAPQALGWIVAAASVGSLLAYGGVALGGQFLGFGYSTFYWIGGGITVGLAVFCWQAYPEFRSPVEQRKDMVLRRRYWLYYSLVFMGGARRQIFMVFAAFMMVEKFGLEVHQLAWLFVINYLANMIFAPLVGRLVQQRGERLAMIIEYLGLIGVFSLYVGIYLYDWSWQMAATLYVLDHLFFAMAFAQKTYFQKIADPADQAPTAAVAFTINHIAAVFLPATLGYLWLIEPMAVFVLAVGMSCISLFLAFLVPRHPRDGHETVFQFRPVPAE